MVEGTQTAALPTEAALKFLIAAIDGHVCYELKPEAGRVPLALLSSKGRFSP